MTTKPKDKFAEKSIALEGPGLAYRLFEPKTESGKQYPLVVYLHGAGERGSDTALVLKNSGPLELASEKWQAKHPCYVFAPQCREGKTWITDDNVKLVLKAIQELLGKYPIDGNRIYITGISMGGMGTWNLIAKNPDLFAAAMPVCGAGIPREIDAAKSVPVWAFHAADDPAVPVSGPFSTATETLFGSRRMVIRLRSIGNRHVHYTEYPAGFMQKRWGKTPHESWVAAYNDEEALEWLFKQDRKQRYEIVHHMPGIWQIGECWFGTHFYVVEGADKALVIDTGMVEDTLGLVKSLTSRPCELILTHVHHDHINNAHQFGKFYMSKRELPIWDFYKAMVPNNKSKLKDVIDIKHGEKIDLGGGVVIEAFELPGHSPGSLMLIDRYHHVCFVGDTVGNGEYAWIQIPGSLSLTEFKASIERFLEYLRKEGLEDIVFLGGHRRQEWNYPDLTRYNPLSIELLEDMSKLCTMIVKDEVETRTSDVIFDGKAGLCASYGMANILFNGDTKK